MSAPVLSAETLAQIVSKAAGDSAFRSKLLDAPHEALASLGIRLPEGLTVRFVQDTAGTRHFVLPPLAGNELSDEDLDKAAGGFNFNSIGQQLGGGTSHLGGATSQLSGGTSHLGGAGQQLGIGINDLNKQLG
jgi:hypothetical protein